jgi:predicted phosphodiesterase
LHEIARKYGVHTVFSGHVHRYARLERDGVQYVLVGSSGGSLRGHHPNDHFTEGWFYSHIIAEIEGGEVKLEVKETGAPFGKSRRFLVGQEKSAGLK